MILDCLKPIGENVLKNQCGYKPNYFTIDNIFGIRQSMEKLWTDDAWFSFFRDGFFLPDCRYEFMYVHVQLNSTVLQ